MYVDDIPSPEKVEYDSLTPTPDMTPSEHSDWADMDSSTELYIRDESDFDVSGIAFLDDSFEYDYFVGASMNMVLFRRFQEHLDWFEHDFEADSNGIDESSEGKYSLESQISALARQMLTDGHTHALKMVGSSDDIRVEYAEHPSMNRYVVQILWKN
jgi:hypothetical protein